MIEISIKHPINSAHGTILLEFEKKIKEEEFVCIFGESGAGKTTILRIIAGLLRPDFGYIKVGDELWLDTKKEINLAPQKRKVGFVFQDYALFPNLSVEKNISYALDKKANKEELVKLLDIMGLKEFAKRYPSELSGGQAQRVALARAIARKPQILLLDEPLSALDLQMRSRLQDELLDISRRFKLTSLLVSHDIAEIYKLSQRVIELKNGKILRDCTPKELFAQKTLSAKFQLQALVLEIEKADILFVLSLLIGQEFVKLTLTQNEMQKYSNLKVGDSIIISQKAFNMFVVG